MLYYPLVWVEYTDELRILIVDGAQRLQAMKNAKKEFILVQWMHKWVDKRTAFLEGTCSSNAIRYEPSDRDLLEIARRLGCTAAQLEDYCNRSRRTLDKVVLVARYNSLFPLVEHGVFSVNTLSQFITNCEGDNERIERLEKVLIERLKIANKGVQEAQAEIAALGDNVEIDKGLKERARIKSYFKGIDFSELKADIKGGAQLKLQEKSSKKKFKSIRIGSDPEWADRRRIPIFGLDGTDLDEVSTPNLQLVVNNWKRAGQKLEQLLEERIRSELPPLSSTNPAHKEEPIEKPTEQDMSDIEITPRQDDEEPKHDAET